MFKSSLASGARTWSRTKPSELSARFEPPARYVRLSVRGQRIELCSPVCKTGAVTRRRAPHWSEVCESNAPDVLFPKQAAHLGPDLGWIRRHDSNVRSELQRLASLPLDDAGVLTGGLEPRAVRAYEARRLLERQRTGA